MQLSARALVSDATQLKWTDWQDIVDDGWKESRQVCRYGLPATRNFFCRRDCVTLLTQELESIKTG